MNLILFDKILRTSDLIGKPQISIKICCPQEESIVGRIFPSGLKIVTKRAKGLILNK